MRKDKLGVIAVVRELHGDDAARDGELWTIPRKDEARDRHDLDVFTKLRVPGAFVVAHVDFVSPADLQIRGDGCRPPIAGKKPTRHPIGAGPNFEYSGSARPQQAGGSRTSHAVWIMAVALGLNLLMAERVGFVVASTVLFWCSSRAFDDRHPVRDGVFALGVSVSAYLLFARALQLPLPAGILGNWI